jgi:hypothetical protein
MQNAMGVELTQGESEVVEVYRKLEAALRDRGDELPPFARRNATKALAALWQVMNGLDMDPAQPYDLGA